MRIKKMKSGGLLVLGTAAALWTVMAHSQYGGEQGAAGLQITECSVYSEAEPSRSFDCTAKVQELCGQAQSQQCELPIGLSLTGGRDIDGDNGTWEKVRVRYKCGGAERINGPHHQNDHASIILSCFGG